MQQDRRLLDQDGDLPGKLPGRVSAVEPVSEVRCKVMHQVSFPVGQWRPGMYRPWRGHQRHGNRLVGEFGEDSRRLCLCAVWRCHQGRGILVITGFSIGGTDNLFMAGCISNHWVGSCLVQNMGYLLRAIARSVLGIFPGRSWLIVLDPDATGWIFSKTWPVLFLALRTDRPDLVACFR